MATPLKIAKKNITIIIAKFVVVAYYYITKDMVRFTICATIATHIHVLNKPYLTKPSSMGHETFEGGELQGFIHFYVKYLSSSCAV
jgi:hypothetical protein